MEYDEHTKKLTQNAEPRTLDVRMRNQSEFSFIQLFNWQ